jgi:hypothetical protein
MRLFLTVELPTWPSELLEVFTAIVGIASQCAYESDLDIEMEDIEVELVLFSSLTVYALKTACVIGELTLPSGK